jgi:hypothetical protein
MCIARRSLSPRARRFLAIGNLCLSAGLLMPIPAKDFALHHADIYDGLRGLLLGLAIGFYFGALRLARSCPENHARS